ncbi:MAG: carboxypeptidase-like regulatory domain-containing protein, partial [Bacteroidota bacterium]
MNFSFSGKNPGLSFRFFLVAIFLLYSISDYKSQNCVIKGKVVDVDSREVLPFTNIGVQGTNIGVTADVDGNYILDKLSPGVYNIVVSFTGYETQTIPEVSVTTSKPTVLNIELKTSSVNLNEVEVNVNRFEKSDDSPLSKFTIRSTEIMRNPG